MSVGQTLAKARGQAGLTVTQVSALTRIREAIINDIERDDYGACGGDFYARGHIRAIAQAVGADSEPLIQEYDSANTWPSQAPPPEPPTRVTGPAIPRRWHAVTWATAVILALLVGAGLAIYLASGPRKTPGGHPAANPVPGRSGRTGNSAPQGAAASPFAHKVVIRVSAVSACPVDFTSPAGLLLLHANVAAGTSKTWTFYRAVDMKLGNPHGVRLMVDGTNPLPAGAGAGPVSLRLGLNRAVTVTSTQPARPVRTLRPVRATAFGPSDSSPGDNGQLAAAAIDGNPGTAWHSDWYATADFGGLEPGTGLLLDMGRTVTITAARIALGSSVGANFQLRVGSAPTMTHLSRVAGASNAAGSVALRPAIPANGRYVLIWFTSLPADGTGTFRVSVYDVRLAGRA